MPAGIDDPYEVPKHPDLAIEPATSVADAVDLVMDSFMAVDG